MRTPEYGPIDPNSDTAKAMREIEREWREKMGLPPIEAIERMAELERAGTTTQEQEDAVMEELLALREKWITKDATAH